MARPALPSRPAPAKLPPKGPAKTVPAKGANRSAAKTKPKGKAKPARGRGSEALGLVVLSGAVLVLSVVALPVCVLLVVGMTPTIVAYIVGPSTRRTWRRSVQ